jgi:hypothetical protein
VSCSIMMKGAFQRTGNHERTNRISTDEGSSLWEESWLFPFLGRYLSIDPTWGFPSSSSERRMRSLFDVVLDPKAL